MEVPLLPSYSVVEGISIGLASLKNLTEWLVKRAPVPDNPLTILELLSSVIHISILTDFWIGMECPSRKRSRFSGGSTKVIVGHLLSEQLSIELLLRIRLDEGLVL